MAYREIFIHKADDQHPPPMYHATCMRCVMAFANKDEKIDFYLHEIPFSSKAKFTESVSGWIGNCIGLNMMPLRIITDEPWKHISEEKIVIVKKFIEENWNLAFGVIGKKVKDFPGVWSLVNWMNIIIEYLEKRQRRSAIG